MVWSKENSVQNYLNARNLDQHSRVKNSDVHLRWSSSSSMTYFAKWASNPLNSLRVPWHCGTGCILKEQRFSIDQAILEQLITVTSQLLCLKRGLELVTIVRPGVCLEFLSSSAWSRIWHYMTIIYTFWKIGLYKSCNQSERGKKSDWLVTFQFCS